MQVRTTSRTSDFVEAFILKASTEPLPAGSYYVDIDEELIAGASFPAYRRTMTLLHLQPDAKGPGTRQTLVVDGHELDAALARDQAQASLRTRPV